MKVRRQLVKYSPVGGFTPARLGGNLPSRIQEALCRAANGSLAAGTWSQYESCWRTIQKLVEERGMKVRFPLTTTSLRMIMGVLVESGRKCLKVPMALSNNLSKIFPISMQRSEYVLMTAFWIEARIWKEQDPGLTRRGVPEKQLKEESCWRKFLQNSSEGGFLRRRSSKEFPNRTVQGRLPEE